MGLDINLIRLKQYKDLTCEEIFRADKFLCDYKKLGARIAYDKNPKFRFRGDEKFIEEFIDIYSNSTYGTIADAVGYWRNAYNILDWFNKELDGIENCEYREVSLDVLEKFMDDCVAKGDENSIGIIRNILTTTDWDSESIYFFAWW